MKTKKERMEDLILLIKRQDDNYYLHSQQEISDQFYDQLFTDLVVLERETGIVLEGSPTKKLTLNNLTQSNLNLVTRKLPMLSIDNTNNQEGLINFEKRVLRTLDGEDVVKFVCELKIDGISSSLIFKNYKLFQITTRGDGFHGEDVTFNKSLIIDLPNQIDDKIFQERGFNGNFEVRGEIYINKQEFTRMNNSAQLNKDKLFSNPRNAASGTMRTLNLSTPRSLNFFAYQIIAEQNWFQSQQESLQVLKKIGFQVTDFQVCETIDDINKFFNSISKKRDLLKFSIDGIVIKVDDLQKQRKLGEGNRFPRWSLAYKFPARSAKSFIKEVSVSISKSGRVTYVAIIDPVWIDGSRIINVTLHNFKFIKDKKINIGDHVLISKAGDIIPQISEVIKSPGNQKEHWEPPIYCHSCSSLLTWEQKKNYQICVNINCFERVINYIEFFTSRKGLNIKGISKKILEKLYLKGLVKQTSDLFKLRGKREQILEIEGFKKKSVENLLSSIEKSSSQKLSNIITSFSIPLLSSLKAKQLSSFFQEKKIFFVKFINEKNFHQLEKIIGKRASEEFEKFFSLDSNRINFLNTLKLIEDNRNERNLNEG